MIEAMACGTPVIAYPYGSVPEIMKEGVSGFIVPDAQSAAAAVKNIGKIDRRKCRQYLRNDSLLPAWRKIIWPFTNVC